MTKMSLFFYFLSWLALSQSYAGVNDPEFKKQWYLQGNYGIDLMSVIEELPQGEEVVVAILDTGVDASNKDLRAQMWVNKGEIPGDGIDNDNNGYIDDIHGIDLLSPNSPKHINPINNHGTHIAGVIAAEQNNGYGIFGIASNAKIMAIRVIPDDATEDEIDPLVARAIRYAVDNGAKILNCSFTHYNNLVGDHVQSALEHARDNGVLVINSAGNGYRLDGVDLDKKRAYLPEFRMSNQITIASAKQDGTNMLGSNYGAKTVHVAVAGDKIHSLSLRGSFESLSGTSMATGVASGVAALLWGIYPDLSLEELKAAMVSSITPHKRWSKQSNFPIMNAGVMSLPKILAKIDRLAIRPVVAHPKVSTPTYSEVKKSEAKVELEPIDEEQDQFEFEQESKKPSDFDNYFDSIFEKEIKDVKKSEVKKAEVKKSEVVKTENVVNKVVKKKEIEAPVKVTAIKQPKKEKSQETLVVRNSYVSGDWLLRFWPELSSFESLGTRDGDSFKYNKNQVTEVTESSYDAIIGRIAGMYSPMIKRYGYSFTIRKNWDVSNIISTETAAADVSHSKKTMKLTVMGNIAKLEGMTTDTFSLIVCHEMGHLLAPGPGKGKGSGYAATEGEADYFASQICLKQLWENEKETNKLFSQKIPAASRELCDKAWQTQDQKNLCHRIVYASYVNVIQRAAVGQLFSSMHKDTHIDVLTADLTKVEKTEEDYPQTAQCQFDNLLAGSLCTKGSNFSSVASLELGILDRNDIQVQKLAAQDTCSRYAGDLMGTRPQCWYKPELSFKNLNVSELSVKGSDSEVLNPGDHAELSFELENNAGSTLNVRDSFIKTSSDEVMLADTAKLEISQLTAGQKLIVSKRIKISEQVSCGEKIAVDFNISTDKGSANYSTDFQLGEILDHTIGNNNEGLSIGYKGTGDSRIFNNSAETVVGAEVEIDMFHENPIDFTQLFLVSPAGNSYKLVAPEYVVPDCYPPAMLAKYPFYKDVACVAPHLSKAMKRYGSLKSTHVLKGILEENGRGDWKLMIKENGFSKVDVKSWSLKLKEAKCLN